MYVPVNAQKPKYSFMSQRVPYVIIIQHVLWLCNFGHAQVVMTPGSKRVQLGNVFETTTKTNMQPVLASRCTHKYIHRYTDNSEYTIH